MFNAYPFCFHLRYCQNTVIEKELQSSTSLSKEREQGRVAFYMASNGHDVEKIAEEIASKKEISDDGDGPIPGNGSSLESNLEKLESEEEYPSGLSFILLTIGLMAVVLVLALDNYIISESQAATLILLDSKS